MRCASLAVELSELLLAVTVRFRSGVINRRVTSWASLFSMRYFNTAGPCRPEDHYMLPASERLPELRALIDQKAYFVSAQ